jgi:hypothetical protein
MLWMHHNAPSLYQRHWEQEIMYDDPCDDWNGKIPN